MKTVLDKEHLEKSLLRTKRIYLSDYNDYLKETNAEIRRHIEKRKRTRQRRALPLVSHSPASDAKTQPKPLLLESSEKQNNNTSTALSMSSSTSSSNKQIATTQSGRHQLPQWHTPWELMRVISGHTGWVRCAAVDISNEWFVTGSSDRMIKVWDLASGKLRHTLTGHVAGIRGVALSDRHPYLFSVGEDKAVKCWDLEYNKAIRTYHGTFGHFKGIYSVDVHPALDIVVTAGRDRTARVWDMRSRDNIHVLTGHTDVICTVRCQANEPQVITGSVDTTIRLWDLAAGKTRAVLTHHKKSVRALEFHPTQYSFVSGATDNIKVWQCPQGRFLRNISGHTSIINSMALNEDDVLVSAGAQGYLYFWDWKTGYNFQTIQSKIQPGSLEGEREICDVVFDRTGTRLITCEADKTIKIWRAVPGATRKTHPFDMRKIAKLPALMY